ncbi:MAG: ribonuclease HII, partial [Alphaproteobacteria bacterium]|nr:ribonuclease HII [Alphaproteobacteria bacterium]
MPTLTLERRAGGLVAGVDEAGRGPLAGPVVAAAVIFHADPPRSLASRIDDSKALSAGAREAIDAELRLLAARGGLAFAIAA